MDGIKLDPLKVNPEETNELLEEKTETPEVPEEVREIPVKPVQTPKNPKVPLVKRAAKPLGVGALCGCLLGGGYLAGMAGSSTGNLQDMAETALAALEILAERQNAIIEHFNEENEYLNHQLRKNQEDQNEIAGRQEGFNRSLASNNALTDRVLTQLSERVEKVEKSHGGNNSQELREEFDEKLFKSNEIIANGLNQLHNRLKEVEKSLEGADEGLTMLVEDVPKLLEILKGLKENGGTNSPELREEFNRLLGSSNTITDALMVKMAEGLAEDFQDSLDRYDESIQTLTERLDSLEDKEEDETLRDLRDQMNELRTRLGQITETSQYAEQTAEKNSRAIQKLGDRLESGLDNLSGLIGMNSDDIQDLEDRMDERNEALNDVIEGVKERGEKNTRGLNALSTSLEALKRQHGVDIGQVRRMAWNNATDAEIKIQKLGDRLESGLDNLSGLIGMNSDDIQDLEDRMDERNEALNDVIEGVKEKVEELGGNLTQMEQVMGLENEKLKDDLEKGLRSLFEEFNVEKIKEAVKAVSVEDLEGAGLKDLRIRHENFRLWAEGAVQSMHGAVNDVKEMGERLVGMVNDSNNRVATLRADAYHRWATFINAISNSSEDADAVVQGLTDWINSYTFQAPRE